MKKHIFAALASTLISLSAASQTQGTQGGFVGPTEQVTTIAELEAMTVLSKDKAITLKGYIKSQVAGEKYRFEEVGGKTIVLEIDEDAWGQLKVTPDMMVLLHGEAEREVGGLEIDIDRVTKADAQ
jgi:uncharacterized protein (TIGR00156 family)